MLLELCGSYMVARSTALVEDSAQIPALVEQKNQQGNPLMNCQRNQ
jgi:hypothetical protein